MKHNRLGIPTVSALVPRALGAYLAYYFTKQHFDLKSRPIRVKAALATDGMVFLNREGSTLKKIAVCVERVLYGECVR